MALCSACRALNVPALVTALDGVPPWWDQSSPRGMVLHHDARQLPSSAAQGCPMCALIQDSLLQHNSSSNLLGPSQLQSPEPQHLEQCTPENLDEWLTDGPIYLRPSFDPFKSAFPEDHAPNGSRVRGFKIFAPVRDGILTAQLRLFASRDSAAATSCDVIGRPPLPSPDSPEAFRLISRWMNACLGKHVACKQTLSGTVIDESSPPNLPTRVIHVGSPNGGKSPRLLETAGKCGHYVALSHCWGPPHKRMLTTTQSNLHHRLAGIPWRDMPKLFQDAITTTYNLGFEYLWIDALCIVQDSHADWLSESRRMGLVYENARLTIAASHASDSSQGCFLPRPESPVPVELAHISQSGACEGSIFAAPISANYRPISPEHGPLATRAWATQEWLLSRRMIFYTAECLVWSCKVLSQRETGGSFHDTARNSRWKNIIEKYSARSLTKAGDRLIALEGLRTELARTRTNDVYCHGLWKHSMPDQLLWYCVSTAERRQSPLNLPTWSWASTMHGVRFLNIKSAKNACSGFRFEESAESLTIRAPLRDAPKLMFPLPSAIGGADHISAALMTSMGAVHKLLPSGRVGGICDDDGTHFGWVILDESILLNHADISCLGLMQGKVSTQSDRTKIHQAWILLLRSIGPARTFERVGVGIILAPDPFFKDQSSTEIYLQ